MNESPFSRPPSSTSLAPNTSHPHLTQTRSNRASSTCSSSSDAASNQSTGSAFSSDSASKKRKHESPSDAFDGLDVRSCPRTAAPALGTVRHRAGSVQRSTPAQCFTSSPASISSRSSLRYRRSKAASVTAPHSKGSGTTPVTPALRRPLLLSTSGRSLTQDTVLPVEQQFKRARLAENYPSEANSPALSPSIHPSSPAYAAVSKESPAAVGNKNVSTPMRHRFKRATSLPLEDEIVIFRKPKAVVEVSTSRASRGVNGVPSITVQGDPHKDIGAAKSPDSGSAPNTARQAPAPEQKIKEDDRVQELRSLTHTQLLTLHQLRLPRPSSSSSIDPSLGTTKQARGHAAGTAASKSLFKHTRSASHAPIITPSIPKLSPPITRHTLKELDLQEILKLRQVRHDVVFDASLMFCPNYEGARGDRKREANERYWLAITRELQSGCRCTAFSFAPSATAIQLGKQSVLLPCICRSTSDSVGPISTPLSSRLPSRITALVAELRDILLALLPLTPPDAQQDEATRANSLAMQKMVTESLDPELITQEVVHNVLDVSALARFLGQLLKAHCAPMRDELVDLMMASIEKGRSTGEMTFVSTGLRMCFDILELMKLDIANHQLRLERPYLLETAPEFELKSFKEGLRKDEPAEVTMGMTKKWISEATGRVTMSAEVVGSVIFRAILDGILELIFRPDCLPAATSVSNTLHRLGKPARQSGMQTTRKHRSLDLAVQSCVPETLQLDTSRLQMFHSDVVDLTIISLLLLLYRQLCSMNKRIPNAEEMETVKKEVWIIMTEATAQLGGRNAPKGLQKLQNTKWRESMQDVLLQLARRSVSGIVDPTYTPPPTVLNLLNSWMTTNIQPDSKLFVLIQTRVRSVLAMIVNERLATSGPSRGVSPLASNATSNTDAAIKRSGLAEVTREVRLLADRIATLVAFHDKAYHGLYETLIPTA